MQKMFIGNLNFHATEEELFEFFIAAGHQPSAVTIMTERDTGRSRGFGFVTLGEDGDMERAIQDLNGLDFQGRALTVNEAKPLEPRTGSGNLRARNGNGRREPRW